MSPQVSIYSSKQELLDQTLALILEKARSAIAQHDRFAIALSGGGTPKPLYENLSKTDQDWQKWHIFWGDERYVPADHADSNERMAREAWLNHVPIPAENIHPLDTTAASAETSATQNQTTLQEFWSLRATQWPKFDFILLGMGDDGHTASLFPGTEALQVCDRWVTVGNKGDSLRLTLTVPVINQARTVAFLIAGANKNSILKDIFLNASDDPKYPVELIHPEGTLYWLLDQEAGRDIPNS